MSLSADVLAHSMKVDVEVVNTAVERALTSPYHAFNSKAQADGLPPLPRMQAAQSSPNLLALNEGRKSLSRARSVDIFSNNLAARDPLGGSGPLDLGEVLRRSEAARQTSMDVSHVPGLLSWPIHNVTPGLT